MNGPEDIRRALGRLALAMAVLGFASLALGAGLLILGLAGGAALALGGELGGGAGLSALAIIVGVVVAAGGIPELLAWYGISKRAPWGRWLGIVVCTTMLAAFPLGTAFGAWGLWVLLSGHGVRAFGLQRSWLGDGAALLVGWFFMPDGDERSWRVDRRGRRHRRGRHGGGGALLLLLLFIGVCAFATCGSCASSFASGVSSAASGGYGPGGSSSASWRGEPGGAPAPVDDSSTWGTSWGRPAAAGAQAGSWLRELGVLDAAATNAAGASTGGSGPGAPTPAPPAPAAGDAAAPGAATATGGGGTPAPAPSAPPVPAPTEPAPRQGTGELWVFEGADGVTHIVDDPEKIPANRRHTARRP